ncbi:hypothetical protein [Pedobacter sp. SL55]|uniref:hypothetical protein n=1 Tax=Pedobacter sp. SL55 TaxID=2995161 RepID=UPI0022709194|nr:hypothetical protein [Pedobacter sp. SL55]WAC42244.1 hypothetical protein OVA16_07780 [Pedobacter sp. SL55]
MRKHMFPIFLAILAAIATIGGAIWQAIEKNEADRKADANQLKADKSQAEAVEYLKQLNAKNAEIQELQKLNISKAEKIIKDQNETFKHVTGDGVPEVWIGGSKIDKYLVSTHNTSNYPLYDLQIDQIDLSELVKQPLIAVGGVDYFDDAVLESLTVPFVSATVMPPKTQIDIPIKLFKKKEMSFVMYKIHTRHGLFFQYCAILNIPEHNLISFKFVIFKWVDGKYIEVRSNTDAKSKEFLSKNCPYYKKEIKVFKSQ